MINTQSNTSISLAHKFGAVTPIVFERAYSVVSNISIPAGPDVKRI
ncbi:MAG: hypothetical protein KBD26_00810 [Candidatus Pacebacteria bacterium]|nr:hypothetical protein [Candidatus Paceibacterota bacterium]QQR76806.1 MAG: hypothetical protein IPJ63_00870 [Candidatus Nomurabacteria bacterium]